MNKSTLFPFINHDVYIQYRDIPIAELSKNKNFMCQYKEAYFQICSHLFDCLDSLSAEVNSSEATDYLKSVFLEKSSFFGST